MTDINDPRWLRQLLQAPELALLTTVDTALKNLLHVLAGQHPTLLHFDDASCRDAPSLRQARQLLHAVWQLLERMRDYEDTLGLDDDCSQQQREEDMIF